MTVEIVDSDNAKYKEFIRKLRKMQETGIDVFATESSNDNKKAKKKKGKKRR